jgi:DNA-binding YbaB/EbfC family protein
MNMQQLMKQAEKMQEQLRKQMESTVIEATAGGGMVSVKMNGNKQLISVQVDPEVFAGGDKEMLQDLIVAAVNEGIRKVDEALNSSIGSMTGGLKLPGLT